MVILMMWNGFTKKQHQLTNTTQIKNDVAAIEMILMKILKLQNTSSNDVLLEAFTNTQRICSNLKQELQKQQQDNAKLKVRLQSYASNSDKINEKVRKI
ncbi:CMF_HP2_G0012180.mRNA.1.CDS.1 [Saccharomyces cerevisiae]|nr:CMF_HP2_G0012180.mRNA.1.CDS.1 [Saccharomyces cerevisiae]CAI6443341.1 CMF_HP2_G0012180.mRNA.1.CDS.1 [Saccharomyces cerevisiae]